MRGPTLIEQLNEIADREGRRPAIDLPPDPPAEPAFLLLRSPAEDAALVRAVALRAAAVAGTLGLLIGLATRFT